MIRAGLDSGPSPARLYEFPAPVSLAMRARFGKQQTNDDETYLPLEVIDVKGLPSRRDASS